MPEKSLFEFLNKTHHLKRQAYKSERQAKQEKIHNAARAMNEHAEKTDFFPDGDINDTTISCLLEQVIRQAAARGRAEGIVIEDILHAALALRAKTPEEKENVRQFFNKAVKVADKYSKYYEAIRDPVDPEKWPADWPKEWR